MNGPTAVATPPSPDQAPMALGRSSGLNEACRIARLPGVSSAPPAPCNARAAIRNSTLGARPQASEASANHMVPITKSFRRPYVSPSDPPSSSSPASVSVYPSTTHCMLETWAWKSLPIAGSAMPTTVASSAAIPDPSTVAASTHRPVPLAYLRVGAALTTVQATAQVLVDVAAQPPGLTA